MSKTVDGFVLYDPDDFGKRTLDEKEFWEGIEDVVWNMAYEFVGDVIDNIEPDYISDGIRDDEDFLVDAATEIREVFYKMMKSYDGFTVDWE